MFHQKLNDKREWGGEGGEEKFPPYEGSNVIIEGPEAFRKWEGIDLLNNKDGLAAAMGLILILWSS